MRVIMRHADAGDVGPGGEGLSAAGPEVYGGVVVSAAGENIGALVIGGKGGRQPAGRRRHDALSWLLACRSGRSGGHSSTWMTAPRAPIGASSTSEGAPAELDGPLTPIRPPLRDRKFADSLLEEGVSSEPVSEARNSRRAPPVAA